MSRHSQGLQGRGGGTERHEERGPADQREEAAPREHRQDRAVAGLHRGLGGGAKACLCEEEEEKTNSGLTERPSLLRRVRTSSAGALTSSSLVS